MIEGELFPGSIRTDGKRTGLDDERAAAHVPHFDPEYAIVRVRLADHDRERLARIAPVPETGRIGQIGRLLAVRAIGCRVVVHDGGAARSAVGSIDDRALRSVRKGHLIQVAARVGVVDVLAVEQINLLDHPAAGHLRALVRERGYRLGPSAYPIGSSSLLVSCQLCLDQDNRPINPRLIEALVPHVLLRLRRIPFALTGDGIRKITALVRRNAKDESQDGHPPILSSHREVGVEHPLLLGDERQGTGFLGEPRPVAFGKCPSGVRRELDYFDRRENHRYWRGPTVVEDELLYPLRHYEVAPAHEVGLVTNNA